MKRLKTVNGYETKVNIATSGKLATSLKKLTFFLNTGGRAVIKSSPFKIPGAHWYKKSPL